MPRVAARGVPTLDRWVQDEALRAPRHGRGAPTEALGQSRWRPVTRVDAKSHRRGAGQRMNERAAVRLAELALRSLEERLRKRRSRHLGRSDDSPSCLISSMKRSTESKSRYTDRKRM